MKQENSCEIMNAYDTEEGKEVLDREEWGLQQGFHPQTGAQGPK